MARFVTLKTQNGSTVEINPEHVALISGASDNEGRALLGTSILAVQGAPPILVSRSPNDVRELLEGGVVADGQ